MKAIVFVQTIYRLQKSTLLSSNEYTDVERTVAEWKI